MAKDAELDHLKTAQDLAFNRKQTAYDALDAAGKVRTTAGDKMHAAFEEKQHAYDTQQTSWRGLQRLRDSYGPRIEQLKAAQEAAYKNMGAAFDNAKAAHDSRNGAAAKSYSEQGRAYQAQSRGFVEERRSLVAQLRSATDRHNAYTPVFQAAKERFNTAKTAYDSTKAAHEHAQVEFKTAKAAFDSASKAFKARLDTVKAQNAKKVSDKRSIAQRAGVPYQYLDQVRVSTDTNGNTNIYFGGIGEPAGPGHGHYVMNPSGNVTYKREPYDEHGAKNFAETQRDYTELIGAEVASGGEFGFHCRFRGYYAHVESNTNREGRQKIDIYYGPNGPFGSGHHHAVAYRDAPNDFVSDELR